MDTFAQRLRRIREREKRTQSWMAKRLNIHRTTYTKYETGAAEPPIETCIHLCLILHTTPNELMGWGKPDEAEVEPLSEEEIQQALLPWPECLPPEERRQALEMVKAYLLESAKGDL